MVLSCCYGSRWKQRWKNVGLPNEKRKPDGQNMDLKWFIMFINGFYDCIAFLKNLIVYLFILGCVGSSFLCEGFL